MMVYLLPKILVAGGALMSLLATLGLPRWRNGAFWVALVLLLAAGVDAAVLWQAEGNLSLLVAGSMIADPFSSLVDLLVVAAGVSSLLLSWNGDRYGPEFPALVAVAVLGMMMVAEAGNLIWLFLGVEVLSLPLYVLAASERTALGGEAGLKYLLLGAFSSGILLFGMALLYGATGTTLFVRYPNLPLGTGFGLYGVGFLLVLVGLGFKVAMVPFHMWVPDVYEGSPTPVTNLMAFGTKVGAAAAILRLVAYGFYPQAQWWSPLIGYLAVLTMIVGNLLALPQRDLKRLLAYSGIGHAGFLLVGIAAHNFLGSMAAVFYLVPYGLAAIGAFALIRLVEGNGEGVQLDDLEGLAYAHPWAAALFIVVMLSLAGIPLTAGFIGKFYLLQAALVANQTGLAVGLVVGTLVGLAAYLRPLQRMFARSRSERVQAFRWSWAGGAVLVVAACGTLFLGVYPSPMMHIVDQSANFFWLR
ncbi:MAG: NADH-quinone oxidoreductase subunit N [Firmicutes bacterium]|nr:NADH-quinone oxidoreductase subunit N [Alicyclobacillaceae bacterium]MCL6497493.1 NADH-quinone oxidoreductase subunit N [Bacillota bacterium]